VSALQYLIAHLCSSASDIFSEGFSKMLDSWGRKCYPGVVPGWVGRAEKKVFSFLLRASPFSYPRKPPSRSSPPKQATKVLGAGRDVY
jgi:hypothetical protein